MENRFDLKEIFALPKWAKIFLGVISVIALLGIVGAFALNKSVQNETFSANLTLKSQTPIESSEST